MKLRENSAGELYGRPDSAAWWMWYRDTAGRIQRASTGEVDERRARDVLRNVIEQVRVMREQAAAGRAQQGTGPLTLGTYGAHWLSRRSALSSHKDDLGRWTKWIAQHALASLPLSSIRVRDVRAFAAELQASALSPRSVQHVYGLLRVMFRDAVADELVAANPCVLSVRRKELPRKRDADPRWRASAVFAHEEVAQLIGDKRITEDRRTEYGLLFLAGMRFGEHADRRIGDLDKSARPLWRLTVSSSFDRRKRESKETKTGAPRNVPVHPVLQALLAEWLGHGWERTHGRPPNPSDWLVPSPTGGQRRGNYQLRRFHADLATLGLRARRLHDARRTFISLALADGANPGLLRWVTHDPPSDQFSQYVSPPWEALCREVAMLQIQPINERRVFTLLSRSAPQTKNPAESADLAGHSMRGVRDLNLARLTRQTHFSATSLAVPQAYTRHPSTQRSPARNRRENVNGPGAHLCARSVRPSSLAV